jgi:hypothetical protein
MYYTIVMYFVGFYGVNPVSSTAIDIERSAIWGSLQHLQNVILPGHL